MPIDRQTFLARSRPPTEAVPVPELGGGATVLVRTLSAGEFLRLRQQVQEDPDRAYAHWLTSCCVNEDGSPLFTQADAEALAGADIRVVSRLIEAAQRVNVASAETAAKNSQTPTDAPRSPVQGGWAGQ